MNQTQRAILLIMVPIIVFIGALGLADDEGGTYNGPFDWESTWPVWIIAAALLTAFFYFMSRRK